MKCSIRGCPGHYQPRRIVHAVRHEGKLLVIDDVPAEVCDVCSDTLLAPETIRRLEELIYRHPEPQSHAPVYAYA